MTEFFTDWLAHYGCAALFILIFVNGLGVPIIPADSLVMAAALFADAGKMNFTAIVISAFIATVLGSTISYGVGRMGGRKLLTRITAFLRIKPEKLAKFEAAVDHRGISFLIIARFVPVARELSGLISGTLGMPFSRYMTGNIIGAFLWVMCWAFIPYFFGHIW